MPSQVKSNSVVFRNIVFQDFGAGAMENWGLITYREYAILYEEGNAIPSLHLSMQSLGVSSNAAKETVAATIAHELAHQWFGDLVTMEWWTDLWLNEGFAAYTEVIGTDFVLPDVSFPDRFLLYALHPALQADSLVSSHPISVEVNDPSEINQIFDSISYLKGSSVLRMMANFLGIAVFNRGVTNYLQGNAFGNANQDNLWQYLTESGLEDNPDFFGSLSVKELMDPWTLQTGYPLISAIRQDHLITLTQSRFLASPGEEVEEAFWWVPVSYAYAEGDFEDTAPRTWLPANEDVVSVVEEEANLEMALILNVKQTGFYRVNYDLENWRKIAVSLLAEHTAIHIMNRAQLLDDAFNVAKAGLLDYQTALDQTLYLGQEMDYMPWKVSLNGFSYLAKMLHRAPGFGAYEDYLRVIIKPLYARLGYDEIEGEPLADSLLRVDVVAQACGLGDPDCVARSLQYLSQWMETPEPDVEDPIPTHVRSTALCTAISASSSSVWEFVYQRYLASSNPSKKITLLESLACSGEVWVLQRFLAMSLNEEAGVKKQDGYRVIAAVAGKSLGRYVAWNWIRDNWSVLTGYFDNGLSTRFKNIISAVADDFNTPFDLKELEDFIEDNEGILGSAESTARQMVELTRGNVLWMEQHYEEVVQWLHTPGKTLGN